jgi:dolichol kinase
MKNVLQHRQEFIDNVWGTQNELQSLKIKFMTHQVKIKLFVFSCLILIGFCLPLIIKTVIIKRVFQFIILSITSFLMLSFIQEKIRNKQSINYLGIILVILYGIGLFLLLRK